MDFRNTQKKAVNHFNNKANTLISMIFTDTLRAVNVGYARKYDGSIYEDPACYYNQEAQIRVKISVIHNVIYKDICKIIKQIKKGKSIFKKSFTNIK